MQKRGGGLALHTVGKLLGKQPWKSWVIRSMGYSVQLGRLVHFILNSSMSTHKSASKETGMVSLHVSQVSSAHDWDTARSFVRIIGDTQCDVVLILDDRSGFKKDLNIESW